MATATFTLHEVTGLLHGPTGEFVDTVGVYPLGRLGRIGEDTRRMTIEPFFEGFTSLDGAGPRFYVGDGSEAEVSVFELVGDDVRLESKVRWTPRDRTIREADLEAARENLIQHYPIPRLLETIISDERLVADRFPTFIDILANRSGGFWVQRYPRLRFPDTAQWLSFDADGHFVCELSLPPKTIVDLGGGYLLQRRRSKFDVEQIVMYRFASP